MNRLGRLPWRLAARKALSQPGLHPFPEAFTAGCHTPFVTEVQSRGLSQLLPRGLHTSCRSFAAGGDVTLDLEHATGLERVELEAKLQGKDIFHEDWLDAPFGTEDNPVQVTSVFSERIVGVPDPADDSIVWWGIIEEGQPPKQLVEGGEFFVLKRLPGGGGGH